MADDAHPLLDAMAAIASDLELGGVLRRIVEAACSLTDAEYGVLATVDESGSFAELVTHGTTPEQARAIAMSSGPGAPADAPLGAPVLVEDRVFGHLYLGDKRGGASFTAEDGAYVVALARSAGNVIRHAAAFEESERRRTWLEATVRVGAMVSSTGHLGEAMEQLVREVEQVTGAEDVALVQFDGLEWSVGAHTPSVAPLTAELDDLADRFADAARSGRPVRVAGEGRRCALIVPLHTELAARGVLLLRLADSRLAVRELEQELLVSFAGQVSLALDRAHALAERHELLLAADRDRIGRDLHDLVIQRLYATGLQLQAARNSGDAERMAEGLLTGVKELDLSIRDLRATIFELGRGIGQKLRDEVRALITEYATVLGFLPVLRTTGPVDSVLPEPAHDQLLLTLREALSNVAKHADASQVVVELVASPLWFMLRVTDDGIGIGPDAGPRSGLGNARHRAEKLGGLLRLAAAGDHGTVLTWLVPTGR